MVRPKSLHACEKQSLSQWRCCSVYVIIVVSSAKSMSLMRVLHILVLALIWARMNSWSFVQVKRLMPSVDAPNACLRRMQKNILKRYWDRIHPCLTLLQILKLSDVLPAYWIVTFMSSWNDLIRL